jgi:hypothetical protein
MSWNFADPFPSLPLDDIFPVSARALTWLARASKASTFAEDHCVQIASGANMLGGLDYHHENFLNRLNHLAPYCQRQAARLKHAMEKQSGEPPSPLATDSERVVLDGLHHEAFAYLNRLGQFYAFAKALCVERFLSRASELMLFRHKHAPHRSIDDPRKKTIPSTGSSRYGIRLSFFERRLISRVPDPRLSTFCPVSHAR